MKTFKAFLLLAACVATLSFTANQAAAQGRGNYDPAQMRERMMERYKEQLSVTNDDEWKVIEGAITKVMDARQELMANGGGFGGFGGGRRGNRGGGTNGAAGENARPRGPFGNLGPEAEDLQKAIDANAPKDEIKAKLAKLRESTSAKEAKLTAAQEDLKKLLTTKQEAAAVLGGLLK